MQKLSLVLLSLMILVVLSSCSSKMLELSLQPTTSDVFTYRTVNETETSISIMGMDQIVLVEQTIDQAYKINEVKPDGTIDVTIKTAAIKMEQTNPMMNRKFDSENPEDSEPKGMLDGLSNMIGKEIQVKLDKKGRMISMDVEDDMLEDLFDESAGGDQMKAQMEGLFGESAISNNLKQLTGFYPEQPVKVGDSWVTNNVVETGMKMNVSTTYTLKERKGGIAVIDFKSDIVTAEGVEPMEMMGMKMTYDLKGTQTGTTQVDEKTGWATKTQSQQDLKGKMNMSGGQMGDMSADMKITTNYSLVKMDK